MRIIYTALICTLIATACTNEVKNTTGNSDTTNVNRADSNTANVNDTSMQLPAPFATQSVRKNSTVIGWGSRMPVAPSGFTVTKFAEGLESPRSIYVADNGDIFVAQANREGNKGNSIILFRDKNKDGVADSKSVFLTNLKQPYGMLILNNKFYVANTDGLMMYDYDSSATTLKSAGKKIVTFPTGRHWTRNLIANKAGNKIYIAIGSASNIAEDGMDKEVRRACILEINPDGSGEVVYASGLRNPVGLDWKGDVLWTAVNERDELGDDLVPDYITSVQKDGFYGWPYSYFGQHEDPRIKEKRPDLVQKAIKPELGVGAHTSSLGLAFYNGNSFPSNYHGGAFIGQHGSWNRSQFSGYKVVFVPFSGNKPSGPPQDFLTGFIADESKSEVYGRPVDVAVLSDGSLLVADDGGNTIWRVSASK